VSERATKIDLLCPWPLSLASYNIRIMEFATIEEFCNFLKEYTKKFARYEYVNPFYNKRKKPASFKVIYLMIGNRFNLFHIFEHTHIYALKELADFLEDYGDGLYPEIRAPFKFEKTNLGKELRPQSLKKIQSLHIVWEGVAVNPQKGLY